MILPLVICNGLLRSGSTWSFNVCRALLPGNSGYFTKEQLDTFIRNDWKSACSPTVAKAHELGSSALAALFSGRAKAICTHRDPRDCVASDLTFLNRDFEYSLSRIAYSYSQLARYKNNSNILMVQYENMMIDPLPCIRRIADHLNITVTDSSLQQIHARTNLTAARKICDDIKTNPAAMVMDSHQVDPATQLHANHIFTGEIGRWKKELTPAQIARINLVFPNTEEIQPQMGHRWTQIKIE